MWANQIAFHIMRTLVIGDIHGGLLGLQEVLQLACAKAEDQLVFLGDYVDGWSQSPEVLNFLIELKNSHNCIFIRGNHDQLLLEWLQSGAQEISNKMWFQHGGEATVLAYEKVDDPTIKEHIAFLENLVDYYIDPQNRLYIHAGFTNLNGVANEYFSKMYYWDRTLWEMALALDPKMSADADTYPKRLLLYDEIYIGHTPVTRIGSSTPLQKANVWNIDTGAAFWGSLTILDVDSKTFWQSKPLCELYFNEKGRN